MAGPAASSRNPWLAAFYLIGALGCIAGMVLRGGASTPGGRAWLILGGGAVSMAYPLIQHYVGGRIEFLTGLGFLDGPRGTGVAWTLALGVGAAYSAFTLSAHPAAQQYLFRPSGLRALSLYLMCVGGTMEEALFRRLIMDALQRRRWGAPIQVLASGLGFGIPHALWGLPMGSMSIAVGVVVATTILGTALALVYLLGHRSLAPCIAAHGLVIAAIEPGLLLAAVGA